MGFQSFQVLGRSEADEVFRLRWTKIRDFTMWVLTTQPLIAYKGSDQWLVCILTFNYKCVILLGIQKQKSPFIFRYGLAILSVTLLPRTPALASPVDCTPWNPGKPANPVERKYARKLCAMNKVSQSFKGVTPIQIDWFVLHFPYLLLCGTLLLFAIEKIFLRAGRSNKVQKKFFDVLVNFGIVGGKEEKGKEHHLHTADQLESRRLLVDLRERLRSSSSYFYSYLLVQVTSLTFSPIIQVVEFVLAAAFAGFIIFKSTSPNIGGLELSNATFSCEVNRQQFKCSGHPTYFYKASMVISYILFLLHALTTLYSLLWTICPCLQSFTGMMIGTDLSRDSRLLVNLLAQGSGAREAVQGLLALQPVQMLELLEPGELILESWSNSKGAPASEHLSVDRLNTDSPKLHRTSCISVRTFAMTCIHLTTSPPQPSWSRHEEPQGWGTHPTDGGLHSDLPGGAAPSLHLPGRGELQGHAGVWRPHRGQGPLHDGHHHGGRPAHRRHDSGGEHQGAGEHPGEGCWRIWKTYSFPENTSSLVWWYKTDLKCQLVAYKH